MSYQDDYHQFDPASMPDLDQAGSPWPYVSDVDGKLFVREKQNLLPYTKALVGALAEARQELALLLKIMDLSARLVTRGLQEEGAAGDAIVQADYEAMQQWRDRYGYPSGKPLSIDVIEALLPPGALPAAAPDPKSREL
jgi:hypothetical protein